LASGHEQTVYDIITQQNVEKFKDKKYRKFSDWQNTVQVYILCIRDRCLAYTIQWYETVKLPSESIQTAISIFTQHCCHDCHWSQS